ncbi:hypothetical protein HX773_18805 [Pantoea sp. B9002]|uniref:glycine-rich domain-containing protein n=1 Tax=Pantoea sp. B9002 TaxID=2726979 RepID=UPI0015A302BC|nr:hypothetical protein [Pantoea sp. B9002]NWA62958.1 hypothetical protein [Pantoea sp. B9002]
MQTSSQPKLLPIPFADAGSKQDIPNDSQIGIVAGRASYNDGFPPLTRTPLAGGGVPPFGTDFNGVFNDITAAIRWTQAGAGYPFNAAFNTAVAGYPKGARIPNSTLDGFWLNTTDGNSANPENTTSALTGWVPSGVYGTTAITGLSGSSVTLTTLQASKDRITLAGTLTANINLVVPAWIKRWEIVNNCTGSFAVTVKTPNGTGVAIATGTVINVLGDGTNIVATYSPGAQIGAPIVMTSTGTYTPSSAAVKFVDVELYAAGGGAAGVPAYTNNTGSVGGGASAGSWVKFRVPASLIASGVLVTIGVGGTSGVSGGGNGGDGGLSSFGSLVSCPGGLGSGYSSTTAAISAGSAAQAAAPTVSASVTTITSSRGMQGSPGYLISTSTGSAGAGGSSPVGAGGGTGASGSSGSNGAGYGSAGGSSRAMVGDTAAKPGGAGAPGVCIIRELA